MKTLIAEFISLDGVVQAPGGASEDTDGGFSHGGWSLKYFDPVVLGGMYTELAAKSDALLQGRRTYQVSAAAWPSRSGDPFTDWINRVQKYVVSNTLTEKDATWNPTTIVRGTDFLRTVAELRPRPGATSTCMAVRQWFDHCSLPTSSMSCSSRSNPSSSAGGKRSSPMTERRSLSRCSRRSRPARALRFADMFVLGSPFVPANNRLQRPALSRRR